MRMMNAGNRKTLRAEFSDPVNGNIEWRKIESLFKALIHKGYAARVEFDAEDRIFFGRIINILDIVTFQGATVDELEPSFREAVDHYLKTCAKLGGKPDKPYSGKLTLRVSPHIHAEVATAAAASGKSINKWVSDMQNKAVHTH